MEQTRNHVIAFSATLTAEQDDFIRRAIAEVAGTILQHHRSQPDIVELEHGDRLTEAAVPSKARAEGRVTVTGTVSQDDFMDSYNTHGGNWDNDHFDIAHDALLSFGHPYDPELKIIAVAGDSFLVQYSTTLVTDEDGI